VKDSRAQRGIREMEGGATAPCKTSTRRAYFSKKGRRASMFVRGGPPGTFASSRKKAVILLRKKK